MNRIATLSALLFLGSQIVGCGGGSDVTTATPEEQKVLNASHEQAAKTMSDAAANDGGVTNPGGHAQ